MDRRVQQVIELLQREWRSQHRLQDLASAVNLGPSRLEHLVRRHANTSIRDLVRRRRVIEAARLLVTTKKRISEISYYVGFSDVSNFNHVFRRELGLSPSEYREREAADGNPSPP
jgi:AraC family transcriptional activator of pobA